MSKREAAVSTNDDDDDDDDDFGPMPMEDDTENQSNLFKKPTKKMKKLEFEHVYLDNLPCAQMYEMSLMHRDFVTHIVVSKTSEFVITGSIDGHVKFWKKMANAIEFVKHYQAHLGPLYAFELSDNSQRLLTTSKDKTIKFFEVQSFDISNMIELDYIPSSAVWLVRDKVAVADANSSLIRIYSAVDNDAAISEVSCHNAPVKCMSYSSLAGVVVSADQRGMIEYWSAETLAPIASSSPVISFKFKSDTDLYALAKAKTYPTSMKMSPSGKQFVIMSKDKQIRVFELKSGKLKLQIDESAQSYMAGGGNSKSVSSFYDEYELGRRLATERELESLDEVMALCKPCFDESGNFLIYGSLAGIKVLNLYTCRVVRVLGSREPTERFLACALYQGTPKIDTQFLLNKAGADAAKAAEALRSVPVPDPTVYCTSFKKRRFFCFSNREPNESLDQNRDILNEAPTEDERTRGNGHSDALKVRNAVYKSAVLHTNYGDISIKLFAPECPKTIENFTTHSKNGYYNGVIFHRVIKGFMIQTGDPEGNGTGGESIWGGEFEDEISNKLRHDRPYTVSMANAGPNTNGSQFFITTAPTSWLDNKHTVFGRVDQGFDVVQKIESSRVNKNDRPIDEIKIISVDVST